MLLVANVIAGVPVTISTPLKRAQAIQLQEDYRALRDALFLADLIDQETLWAWKVEVQYRVSQRYMVRRKRDRKIVRTNERHND